MRPTASAFQQGSRTAKDIPALSSTDEARFSKLLLDRYGLHATVGGRAARSIPVPKTHIARIERWVERPVLC